LRECNFQSFWIKRQKKTKDPITDEQLSFYFAQLISVIEYIHHLDCVYVDFKPDNVLITSDGNLCICVHDEGESESLGFTATSFQYTHKSYQAPEVIAFMVDERARSEYPNPFKTIWWSVGLYMYKLVTGLNPFADARTNQEKDNILNKPLTFPPNISKTLLSLLEKLLQKDPKQRLTDVSQIKSHSFFSVIDWNTICDPHQNKPPLPYKVEETEPFFPPSVPTTQLPIEFSPTPTWLAPVHGDELVGFTVIGTNPTLQQ